MNNFIINNKTIITLLIVFVSGCFLLPNFFTDRIALHQFFNQYHNEFFDLIFTYATYLGDGLVLVPIILYFLIVKNINYAIQLIFLSIVLLVVSQFLKHLVFEDVNRPFLAFKNVGAYLRLVLSESKMHSHNSFPSGHTTTAFSLFLYMAFTLANNFYSKIFLFALALIAGLSRVYLSQHFIEDVVAGAMLGFMIAVLTYWVFNKKILQKEKYNKGLFTIFAK